MLNNRSVTPKKRKPFRTYRVIALCGVPAYTDVKAPSREAAIAAAMTRPVVHTECHPEEGWCVRGGDLHTDAPRIEIVYTVRRKRLRRGGRS